MRSIRIHVFGPCILAVVFAIHGIAEAPDLSGIYWATEYNAKIQIAGALPLTVAGKAAYDKNVAGLKDGSIMDAARRLCVPDGLPRVLATPYPFEIVQGPPGQVTMIYELNHQVRAIRLDKPLPAEKELISLPFYNGHSVGHFEGDTLVVDNIGFKENTWLDLAGHPHSDALHIIERFRRPDFGHMEVQVTIDDPKAYKKPWTARIAWDLFPDTDLLDWVCENEKDLVRLSGK